MALGLLLSALLLGCGGPAVDETRVEEALAAPTVTDATGVPAEIRDFVAFLARQGQITEEVRAEVCYIYERLGIAHLQNMKAELYDTAFQRKDTLDAPEGFLYLKDFVLDERGDFRIKPDHPFYDKIGGKTANIDLLTTSTPPPTGLPAEITRYCNDLDVLGRPGRKIVYRRGDDTTVTCMRAYRDTFRRLLHGVGECEMITETKNQPQFMFGETFRSDDRFKGIIIRGSKGKRVQFGVKGTPEPGIKK